MIQETGVKQVAEHAISVVLDLGGESVEVYYILRNAVSILHLEVLELMLSISDGVVRSKGTLELSDEVDPAVHPTWVVGRITGVEEVWFKPFQRHTFQIGLGECYPCPILAESLSTILEAQFALDQEGPEFFGVSAIKGVRFTDLGTGGRGVIGTTRGAGEAVDGDGEIVEDSQTRV